VSTEFLTTQGIRQILYSICKGKATVESSRQSHRTKLGTKHPIGNIPLRNLENSYRVHCLWQCWWVHSTFRCNSL